MAVVVVERSFDEPVWFDEIQQQENRAQGCLKAHGVRFLRTYFSTDRKRMICLYQAPDAESVRTTQAQAGLPFERVWTAAVCGALSTEKKTEIVVERCFLESIRMEQVEHILQGASSCLSAYRIRHLGACLSPDGKRMICFFSAPDAESVRIAQRQAGVPFERAWPATVHDAPAATD